MKADITYIKKKFEEFNKQMFAGKLPMLPIELSNAKTFLGQCVFKIRRLPNGRTEKYDFRRRINRRVDLSEQELDDSVIRELMLYEQRHFLQPFP